MPPSEVDEVSSFDGEILTHEDVAVEFRWKMSRLLRLWTSENKSYNFRSQADFGKAERLFVVSLITNISLFYVSLHDIKPKQKHPCYECGNDE
jgi:hypothetical protein